VGEDLPPEAWSAMSAIGVALVGVWVEVVRRAAQKNRVQAEKSQEEFKKLVEPVSNGFAADMRRMMQELTAEVKSNSDAIGEVKNSQVDLHRRLDSHLEDHGPKQSRKRRFL
jgi:hypothetical protein